MSNPYQSATEKMSVLGSTLVFKGELTADEDLMLKGTVEGSIEHTATLRIGAEGSVKGDIKAKVITVEGHVAGDLYATDSITIKATATVEGDAYAPSVSLLEGAHFKGRIDMDTEARPARSSTPTQQSTQTAVGAN